MEQFEKLHIFVTPDLSIKEAVRILNEGHRRIVLVVDGERRLLGVAADSDVRRAILRDVSLDRPVREIMVADPVVGRVGMSEEEIYGIMRARNIFEIPVLDAQGRVAGLTTLEQYLRPEQENEVVIMAGGLGTRLMPLTEHTPKPLLPVGGKPMLFILLDQLLGAGFRRITLTLRYKAEMIQAAVDGEAKYRGLVRYVVEAAPLGTAGSLSLLAPRPVAPFFVMNADLLSTLNFRAMVNYHKEEGSALTLAVRQESYQLPFGLVHSEGGRVLGIQEKPVYSYFANAGVYVLDPAVLDLVPAQTFYDMPELVNAIIKDGGRVGSFPVHEYWLDIGNHEHFQKAQRDVSDF